MVKTAEKGGKRRSPLAFLALLLVRAYQLFISPLIGPRCRFQPTCSHYAIEAICLHGGLKGGWLAIRRVIRCHPWGGFGYDPVPKSERRGHGPQCNEVSKAGKCRQKNQGVSSNG